VSRGGRAPKPYGVVALVESNTTGTGRLFAAAARARGFHPVLLSARPDRYPWVAEDGVEVAWADTADPEAVALACSRLDRRAKVAGVLTSSEYFIAAAARAAARLRLPGPSAPAVEQCRDKRRQRAILLGAGVPVPAFEAVGSVRAAIAAATDIGLPVVCKPADGTGSRGVSLCADLAAVASHARWLLTQEPDERGRPPLPWLLVEQYVRGPEVSVETFGSQVVGVTAKHLGPLPHFVEVGHDFPAAAGHEAATTAALHAVDALGLAWGSAHTEVRLPATGPGSEISPVVIEVNPRLAGGSIPVLVQLATGVDLVGAAVDLAVGAAPTLQRTQGAESYASIRFLLPPGNGRVRAVGGLAEAAAAPGVVEATVSVAPGDWVEATGSFLDRLGHVIAAAPTPRAAIAAAEQAVAGLRLELDSASERHGGRLLTGPAVR
jgi:S-sulfo-L-cysteine synthase (3-phospho-L-serine-dependent)